MSSLKRSAGGYARGPSPLEVEASEMPSDVDDFANEEKAGNFFRFHCFGGEFIRVNATCGDFGFFISLGAGWSQRPGMELAIEIFQSEVRPRFWCVKFEPPIRQTIWKSLTQLRFQVRRRARNLRIIEGRTDFAFWGKIDPNWLRLLPVGRDLQDRRTTEPAMSDEHLFTKPVAVTGCDHVGGNSREIAVARTVGLIQYKRHQSGTRLLNL